MADYVRNMEHAVELEVPLEAGKTELVVFLDDLAERDTRFYVQLDWLGGPPARAALPFAADAELVEAVQATLAAMHFERPAYTGGEVAVALPVPLPVDATVEIDVEGDFMSHERLALARSLAAGATRLPLAEAEALPADFRHFRLTVDAGGFVASRVLGVEIAHPQGDPPADRIAEALDAVATRAEPDTVCALARLATGRAGPETEAMIDAALGPIADCWDCADFALVPLIWARMRWGEDLSAALRARIDEAILGYRYWMDEPGNDVQWYFSENHALLFHTAAYLAGHLLPDATFRRSGRSGAEQSAVGRDARTRLARPLRAMGDGGVQLRPLLPDRPQGPDRALRAGPRRRHSRPRRPRHRPPAGDRRELRPPRRPDCSARPLLRAHAARRRLARALRHRPPRLGPRKLRQPVPRHAADGALPARPRPRPCPTSPPAPSATAPARPSGASPKGENDFAHLYHAKTAAWALGSAARYRWGDWGYQETLVQARIGTEPQAQVWINHPGEMIHSGYGRPSYWGGSASVPRVQQYRGLAVVVFDGVAPQPDFTHAWFPRPVFDESVVDGQAAFARSGQGALGLIASGPLEQITDGPSAGCELRLAGRRGRWILRVAQTESFHTFRARFGGLRMDGADDKITVVDPDYGNVLFRSDGTVEAEGRHLDPSDWTLAGERVEMAGAVGTHGSQTVAG